MTMSAGAVTVNPTDGTYTGTGLAKVFMDAHFPGEMAQFPAGQPTAVVVGVAQYCARLANAYASVVSYMQSNAVAHVTTQHLGNVPSGGAGTPIDPPSAAVDIPIQ